MQVARDLDQCLPTAVRGVSPDDPRCWRKGIKPAFITGTSVGSLQLAS